jgi:hypothetical protein
MALPPAWGSAKSGCLTTENAFNMAGEFSVMVFLRFDETKVPACFFAGNPTFCHKSGFRRKISVWGNDKNLTLLTVQI